MDRALGTMAAGTPVALVAMSDTAYRVRGRAGHGDVAGWMKPGGFDFARSAIATKAEGLL